jgi:radical SAM-linked protein
MPRLLFEKTGKAIWISHLDLMRVFQRAFKRAGFPLTHTQGFNPRPSVSIALPLSVGVESRCELLDFLLEGDSVSEQTILQGLNDALIEGIRVLAVYSDCAKIKNLTYLDCELTLEYDEGIPENAEKEISSLFSREILTVEKKGKNGIVRQDIIPMIRKFTLSRADENTLRLTARICCQNPSLNPMQLHAAIAEYLPECKPDFCMCKRIEIYDAEEQLFR